jgi:hypothetical protein
MRALRTVVRVVTQPSMRETLRPFLGAALLLGVALSGCKQSEGERCEVDTDCSTGLSCNRNGMGNGICGPAGSTPSVDAGRPADSAAPVTPDAAAAALDQAAPSPDVSPDVTDAHPEAAPVAPDGSSGA